MHKLQQELLHKLQEGGEVMSRTLSAIACLALPLFALAQEPNPTPATNAKRAMPPSLEVRPFTLPTSETRTLSNGLKVLVATNREVPLWQVRLVTNVGSFADPKGQEGLASAAFDMLNEGAGAMSAEDLSRQLKKLASNINSSGGLDGGSISASGITRNLEPTLDLWAKVLLDPTFPEEDWTIMQKKRIANVIADRKDPSAVSARVFYKLLYEEDYRGRHASEESYGQMTTEQLRAFYKMHITPNNSMIVVGGDLDADTVVPLLEARIGSWQPDEQKAPATPSPTIRTAEKPTLYLVDKPGAAQSIVRAGLPIGQTQDEDYWDFMMGSTVLGGAFTARINMNLREDKGYTYGARCYPTYRHGPGLWFCHTSVRTDTTAASVQEIHKEIGGILGDNKASEKEIAFFKSYRINGFPSQWETTGRLLDEAVSIWRYNRPANWPERYIPSLAEVTTEDANKALAHRIVQDKMIWLVVGDKETIYDSLKALPFEIIELNQDAEALTEK